MKLIIIDACITTTKTAKGIRSLPPYGELLDLLQPLQQTGYIIGNGNTPITGMAYRWMYQKIRERIDLHGATAHVFRHSYLTMLDEAGVDPKALQYIAGHGNFSFTMSRYVHGRKQAAQEAGVKFTELLRKKEDEGNVGSEEKQEIILDPTPFSLEPKDTKMPNSSDFVLNL